MIFRLTYPTKIYRRFREMNNTYLAIVKVQPQAPSDESLCLLVPRPSLRFRCIEQEDCLPVQEERPR